MQLEIRSNKSTNDLENIMTDTHLKQKHFYILCLIFN